MGRVKNPTVTVIIPTYNRALLLGRAIQSVLNQTYQDFELIVVDDASSDNTEEVVRSFADPRIHYLRHEKNRGAAVARNTGIEASQGGYMAFLDSDDEWLADKLEKQMKVFEDVSSMVGVVYTDMWRIGQNGVRRYWHSSRITPEDGIIYYDQLINDRLTGIGIQSAVIRRECFAKVGMFDEALPRLIDKDLFIRLSKQFYFSHIAEALVNYHETEKRISSDDNLLIEAQRLILEKYYFDIAKSRKSLARHQYVIGNLLCQNGEIDQGRDHLLEALRLCPLSIRYLIAAILSLFGERAYNTVARLKRRIQPLQEP